jgi:hypothetical protein
MSDSSGVNEDNVPPQEPTHMPELTSAEIELLLYKLFAFFLFVALVVCLLFNLHGYLVVVELFESIESVECFVRKACSTCPSRQPQCAKLQQAMNTTKKFLRK